MSPNVYIIAGPNGAGKTTVAREFLPNFAGSFHFINADLIAQGLSPLAPSSAAFQAGRLFLEELRRAMERRIDFGFESRLSGLYRKSILRDLKDRGYEIHLVFLWLRHVDLSLARIREGVAKGGHDLPEDAVRRRFRRSIRNFFVHYQGLADTWQLFENSAGEPQLIASHEGNETLIIDEVLFRHLKSTCGDR